MTWLPYTRQAPPRHTAAVLIAAIALAVGVALIATSGGGAGSRRRGSPVAATPPSDTFPHTPAGAVAAATTWCQASEAFFNGTWASVVSALATGAFRARAERLQPASDMVHSRLVALPTPYLARIWPLGYAVQQYSPKVARVRVWQTYVLAAAGPEDMSGFQTTAVSLQWTHGTWTITSSPPGPDLTPPSRRATASQVVSWITSVDQLHVYTYAP